MAFSFLSLIAELLYDLLVEYLGGSFFKSVTIHFVDLTSVSSSMGGLMRGITSAVLP